MGEEHDPLDGLFEVEAAGDETLEAPAGNDTITSTEEPSNDSIDAGAGDDEIVEGKAKMVPKAALDEARNRARDAEARLAERDKPKEPEPKELESQIRDPEKDLPGAFEDVLNVVELNAVNTTLNFSEKAARKEHGPELVDKVMAWAMGRFEKEPEFATTILTNADPYELAIAEYNKAQRAEKIGKIDPEILEGLDEEEADLIRQHRASKSGSTAEEDKQPRGADGKFVPPRRSVEPPPRSIATAPSGGRPKDGTAAVGEGVAFDNAFGGR